MCARKSKKKITQRMFSIPEINHPNVVQDDIAKAKINVLIALFFAFLVGGNVDGRTACSGDGYSAPEVTGRTMR